MAKDCRSCKTYKDCIGKPWFSYQDIRFCPYQVLWILEYADTLRAGDWPTDPDASTYTDPLIKTGYRGEAYFCKPVEILAEVERRLKRTGVDGKLLRIEAENGKALESLEPESRAALMYIKGKKYKKISYAAWKKQRVYRRGG